MSEVAELIKLPPQESALDVYQKPQGLEPWIEKIRQQVSGIASDPATRKGREEIASRAFRVRKSKTALDNLGKQLVDQLKDIPKKVDAERKRMREALDALADEVRQPLTEWEEVEEARVARHKAGIDWFRLRAEENRDLDANELRATLAEVDANVVDESWEEFEAEAHRAKARALNSLTQALAAREEYEAEQAELARLRAEADARRIQDEKDRIAREAAQAATKAAEAKAQTERDAAAKREADAKAAQAKAEQDAKDAVERQKQAEARAEAEKLAAEERAKKAAEAARQAEIERQEQEQRDLAEAQRKREADRAHKAKINSAAAAALVAGGLSAQAGKLAVTLIAQGKVPNAKIHY